MRQPLTPLLHTLAPVRHPADSVREMAPSQVPNDLVPGAGTLRAVEPARAGYRASVPGILRDKPETASTTIDEEAMGAGTLSIRSTDAARSIGTIQGFFEVE